MDLVSRLTKIGFLGRLPPEIANAAVEGSSLVHYPARALTFVGDEVTSAGIAVDGLQRVYLTAPDGRQLTIRYVFRGELLGAIRLPSAHVSIATEALEMATVLHFQPGHLQFLAERHPQLAMALVDEYAERLGRGYRALVLRAFSNIKTRLAQDLYWRAEAIRAARGTPVVVRATQQDLANAIGSVREVVARSIDELRRDGLIELTRAEIRVLDPDRLEAEALA
jgi:CRP/FNR family transcriptional regulator, cyclic AMP receptor protein